MESYEWELHRVMLPDGQHGVICYYYDSTKLRQSEAALAAAHLQTQSIIDNTPAIVYALDLEGRFVMANAALAALLGATPEQMIGKRRHEFMPKKDADGHEANDRQVIEAGKALELEESSQLPDRSITCTPSGCGRFFGRGIPGRCPGLTTGTPSGCGRTTPKGSKSSARGETPGERAKRKMDSHPARVQLVRRGQKAKAHP